MILKWEVNARLPPAFFEIRGKRCSFPWISRDITVTLQDMKRFCLSTLVLLSGLMLRAADYHCTSPNGNLLLEVNAQSTLTWSVKMGDATLLAPSAISLTVDNSILGKDPKVRKAVKNRYRGEFATPFYKKSSVRDDYNGLVLKCSGDYEVQFRVYDDGVAYRFVLHKGKQVLIRDEQAEFNFAGDYKAFVPYVNDNRGGDRYSYSFESYYDEQRLSEIYGDSLAITPLLVCLDDNVKVAVMEGGLEDYAGMFLLRNPHHPHGLTGHWAPLPLATQWGGYMNMNAIPTKRADYIARTDGRRTMPWRAIVVSTRDAELANNDMAQRLAPASRLEDTGWIKPGKVAWDWWNTTNLTGVDFTTGMNTETYRYFIDFAARNRIEYIIIDCGWSGSSTDWKGETLMRCTPDIDLDNLIAYGKEKGVGIILWASWALADAECDTAFPYYAQKGIKGFKIDFLDADNQAMIQSMTRLAEKAAAHRLLLDFHGAKPTGIQRTYPNVVNFEGVKGMENCKWNRNDGGTKYANMLRYDVTIPFIRTLCGPMDYTPGAMTNATLTDFHARNDHPMSLGTRARQVAMYTVFEAPLQMLSDSPTAYERNQDCTDMMAAVPTTFDETRILAGEVGEYIVVARRKGDTWFLGAMTGTAARELTVSLDFLSAAGDHQMQAIRDGRNADKNAEDYRIGQQTIRNTDKISIHLAPGGGWAAIIR